MVSLYDAPAEELVEAVADELAGRDGIEAPDWAAYAKTGPGKELPPEQEDFWARRAASLLRKVAIDGPVGVDRLASAYGSTKPGSTRYRTAPKTKTEGSRNVVRTALQQLEEEGLVEIAQGEGRVVSAEGQSLLDSTAGEVIEDLGRSDLERYV